MDMIPVTPWTIDWMNNCEVYQSNSNNNGADIDAGGSAVQVRLAFVFQVWNNY